MLYVGKCIVGGRKRRFYAVGGDGGRIVFLHRGGRAQIVSHDNDIVRHISKLALLPSSN